ncbi:ABC transporter permease [Thermodesulfatator atlanticus]|uniref:ABC transporter permease n=1 Tax=Thermodesulfatator atlanticus TaxID=501497 RepID=UPI0003B47F3B|nr:ABC transporter permease [Thermodesulfatator atlanticus]
MNPRRIYAVVLRQIFLYRRSFTRVLDVFYWPTVDLLLWGFITLYLERESQGINPYASFFLGGLILWNILLRAQQGISVSFLEDIWARNLINLFVSPLKVSEYLAGLLCISIIKVSLAFLVMAGIAGACFGFAIFKMGLWLLFFVLNLCAMGWAIGLVTMACILRFGQEAEILAWALSFLFLPVSAVFYPVEVLPHFLQKIAAFVPAAYVFEGMRAVILKQELSISLLEKAFLLNACYLALGLAIFYRVYKVSLARGSIPKIGE